VSYQLYPPPGGLPEQELLGVYRELVTHMRVRRSLESRLLQSDNEGVDARNQLRAARKDLREKTTAEVRTRGDLFRAQHDLAEARQLLRQLCRPGLPVSDPELTRSVTNFLARTE
jgi:hypothetical protein